MDLPPDFKELLEEFARDAVELVLVGGYAVAFHGRPRATKDIDLVVEGSAENLTRAAAALARFGAPTNVVTAVAHMQPQDIVYLGQPPLRIDLMRSIDGVQPASLFERAVPAALDGVQLKVISLDDLIANKQAAGRPQDLIDVKFLERVRDRARRP
ncbi:MAG TPA: nucleotidyl transferase AbiEii/AbiGii toxin family protein [Polyangiaceae bacterium]|nr:nucleotidyl transferase AbiEii/AbiGii toxin family protein [Polyangiaceae bacterium]